MSRSFFLLAFLVSLVSSTKTVFFYQGDYNNLAPTAFEVAQLASKYDMVQLTHGMTVLPKSKTFNPAHDDPYKLALVNGGRQATHAVWDGRYKDKHGKGVEEIAHYIRLLNPAVKIYVYVPATADNVMGMWNNTELAQNYRCPVDATTGGPVCMDFWRWVIELI
jgi:hypothetical protein